MRPSIRLAALLAVALVPAACTITIKEAPEEREEREIVVRREEVREEPTPAAAGERETPPTATLVPRDLDLTGRRRTIRSLLLDDDGSEGFVLEPNSEGYPVMDLLTRVSEATGCPLLYDRLTAQIAASRVTFTGREVVPPGRALAWLQAVLYFHRLMMTPLGPETPGTPPRFSVMDMANPAVQSAAIFVPEGEIEAHADREGLYLNTVFPLGHAADPQRVRAMLSQYSTKTAAIGRVLDLSDAHAVFAADFAPTLAVMRRTLEAMGALRSPAAGE